MEGHWNTLRNWQHGVCVSRLGCRVAVECSSLASGARGQKSGGYGSDGGDVPAATKMTGRLRYKLRIWIESIGS